MEYFHQSVLLDEVIEYLAPKSNQNFIDATIGGGGQAEAILKLTGPAGKLLGIDRDPRAVKAAAQKLAKYQERLILICDSYKNLDKIIYGQRQFIHPHGILLDLGLSSDQISASNQRGFSFQQEGRLDMRYGPQTSLTAADILNNYSKQKLIEIFQQFGEEPQAKKIVQAIIDFRKKQPLVTTSQLVEIIKQVKKRGNRSIHPATQTFQALRIAVNNELTVLKESLPEFIKILPGRGRLAVISFHSLEDRIVKQFFNRESKDCLCPKEIPICQCHHQKTIKILTKKAIRPSLAEIQSNPRSRSAKLRVAEKIGD